MKAKLVKTSKPGGKAAPKPVSKSAAKHTTKPATKLLPKAASKPAGKSLTASKATGKSAVKAAAKSAVKSAPKAAAKTLTKPGIKPGAVAKPQKSVKSSVKPAARSVVKPVVKLITKTSAKLPSKLPAAVKKATSKSMIKVATKAADKATPKKPIGKTKSILAAKAPIKTAPKSAPKALGKALAKGSSKSSAKTAAKPVLLAKTRVAPVKTTPAVKSATPSKKTEKTVAPVPVVVAAVVAKPVVQANGLPPPAPLKPGRRSSSRALAHMPPPAPMVPTHAPDAAKASYSTMTERVIAPPPHVAAKKDPKLANNWKSKTAETLTDDEVKAMPDAEYMNDAQLAFFRHKLSILKQDIHNSAGATTEHLREDTTVVPDPADRATIEEEHALELRTRDRERKLLKKIEQSIGRIDSGDYGYCDETGEPIGVGRLIARPTASLSLEAQQRRELKQKMFGD